MDGDINVADLVAPDIAEGSAAPPVPEAAPPAPEATPAPPAADVKPDIRALLKDPEFRKALWEDPEMQHRIDSEGGRRARLELEKETARQKAEAERQRLLQMPSDELGDEVKRQWEQGDREAQIEVGLLAQKVQAVMERVWASPDLTDKDKQYLHPANPAFKKPADFEAAVLELTAKRQAEKMAKEMAKTLAKQEAEAMVTARLAADRAGAETPAVLPPGGATLSDTDFIAAYATGDSNDSTRMAKKMKEWGLFD